MLTAQKRKYDVTLNIRVCGGASRLSDVVCTSAVSVPLLSAARDCEICIVRAVHCSSFVCTCQRDLARFPARWCDLLSFSLLSSIFKSVKSSVRGIFRFVYPRRIAGLSIDDEIKEILLVRKALNK